MRDEPLARRILFEGGEVRHGLDFALYSSKVQHTAQQGETSIYSCCLCPISLSRSDESPNLIGRDDSNTFAGKKFVKVLQSAEGETAITKRPAALHSVVI